MREADAPATAFSAAARTEEFAGLKSQNVISSLRSQTVTSNRGGTRHEPMALTEQGVTMPCKPLRQKVATQAAASGSRKTIR